MCEATLQSWVEQAAPAGKTNLSVTLDFGLNLLLFAMGVCIVFHGRARRGGSGALWPTIRSSGVEFPAEASLFLAGARARGVEGRGPARRAARESRQDRKVAAAAGGSLVRQSASPEPAVRDTRGECCRSRVHGFSLVVKQ